MKYTPDNNNKQMAAQLAGLIYKGEINESDALTYLDKLAFHSEDAIDKSPDKTAAVEQVNGFGIWREEIVEGEQLFVRDPNLRDQFVYWSKTHQIYPKGNKFRVVLLGESVARGFLADPHYNPSIALQNILDQTELDAEVIDLARTNCSIQELELLVKQCVQLRPDAIVIFAGNNWIINAQSLITQQELNGIIESTRDGNKSVIKEWTENKLSALINSLFDTIENVTAQHQLSVLMLNPEFNLRDWRTHETEKIPVFATKDLDKWYALLHKADKLLHKKEYASAEKVCGDIIAMHPENATGYELMACGLRAQGKTEEALKYYRLAHDATLFQTSHCPGATSYVQEMIRKHAARINCFLIDLPLIFNEYLDGDTPGRELFLDYCHLSIEGINVSMYHAAKEIVFLATGVELPLEVADAKAFGPGAKVNAVVHFLAAIHNAHWGQRFGIVYYHCLKALSHFDLNDAMINYIFTASSTCPWRLNKHFEKLVEDVMLSDYLLLAQPEEGLETFDLVLTGAMTAALKEKGTDIEPEVNALRLREHVFQSHKIDLLRTHYWLDYNCMVNATLKKSSAYREFNPISKFYIIGNKWEVQLQLVYRIPYDKQDAQPLEFEINGKGFYSSSTSNKWNTEMINIPAELLTEVLNVLVIRWPLRNVEHKVGNGYTDTDLLHRYMYPATGEIHTLTMVTTLQALRQETENVAIAVAPLPGL